MVLLRAPRSRRARLALVRLVLAATLATAPAALAQETVPAPLYVENVSVDVVSVDVLVAGHDGRPVTGLSRQDFEVLENGKPVEITSFLAAQPAPPASAPSGAEAGAGAPEAPPEATAAQRLSLIVLVDNADLRLANRNVVLAQIGALVGDALGRGGGRAMLVSSGLSIHVRQPLTGDLPAFLAAVNELEGEPGEPVGSAGENALLARIMDHSPAGTGASDPGANSNDFERENAAALLQMARGAARSSYERTRANLLALTQFVDSLAALPGRKALFYIGGGIPIRPGEMLLQRWESTFRASGVAPGFSAALEANRYSVTDLINALVAHANANGVPFYCIDASGERSLGDFSAEQAGMNADPYMAGGDTVSREYSLQLISQGTGGRTLAGSSKLPELLRQAAEDFGTYYSLGYVSPHPGNGTYHTIKVTCKRDGVHLRHRNGYLDRSLDDRAADANLAALLFDIASNPLDLALSVKNQAARDEASYRVTLLVTFPLAKLVLAPQGDAHEARLSVWLAGKDDQGRVTQAAKQSFPVHIPNDKLLSILGQTAGYTFELQLRKGTHKVAVSLRDDLSETDSTATLSFALGSELAGAGPTT